MIGLILSTIMNQCLCCVLGNLFVFAIYIEPPADVRSVLQNYTIHCITSGWTVTSGTVKMYLENHENSNYTAESPPPVLGYSMRPLSPTTLNEAGLIYDYSEEVVWKADRVVVDGTEFSDQGLTKYNGDHDWACHGGIQNYDDTNFLQTYIRGENKIRYFVHDLFLQVSNCCGSLYKRNFKRFLKEIYQM